jgi:hypothetical protein
MLCFLRDSFSYRHLKYNPSELRHIHPLCEELGKCYTKNRRLQCMTRTGCKQVTRRFEGERWNEVLDNLLYMCSSLVDMSAVVSPSGHENLITTSCLSAVMDPSCSCSTQCLLHLSLCSELFQFQLQLAKYQIKLLSNLSSGMWCRGLVCQGNMLLPFSGYKSSTQNIYQTTRYHIPEDGNLHSHRRHKAHKITFAGLGPILHELTL